MASLRLSPSLDALVDALAQLPGFGPRSAQRAAFHLLQDPKRLERLERALAGVRENVRRCKKCRVFCESELCPICSDETRDKSLLCVVESVADELALDASLAWPGLYFVLSGRLNPIDGIGPEEIGLTALVDRIEADVAAGILREVVVATSYTPEGDATAYYLIAAVKKRYPHLRITRLARGLPSGLEIEYTDLSTIAGAVYARRDA
ncbi:recombination protein RecR [Sutterella massiliensis]|uniref:Recombination protein RecR n=1 Tax=Sutterella massiliensis TaxID=1816689 RepID=A0ABS2DRZ4_9BURK|nr:recombination mediator RecR [Sutterella massiliensis]MBM6704074.1 recombination protein RecR [Sutterella massiliensis]